jgi:hypothetical protein
MTREQVLRTLLQLAAEIPVELTPAQLDSVLGGLTYPDIRYWNRLIIPIYSQVKIMCGTDRISDTIQRDLQARFMELLVLQIRQQEWLKRIVNRLKHETIPVILLKGAASIGTLYEPHGARLSQDIDVLVRRRDFEHAVRILKCFGTCQQADSGRRYSDRVRHERSIRLNTPVEFYMEIHRGLAPAGLFTVNEDDIWSRSRAHPGHDSETIRILSNEDALVFIALHSFLHLEFEPHHLADAMRLITRFSPSCHQAFDHAEKWGCATILACLMRQLSFWFGLNGFSHHAAARNKKAVVHARIIHNPLNPEPGDPGLMKQIRSMVLHDRYHQVILFSFRYLFKRSMDGILRLQGDRQAGNPRSAA